MTDTFLVTVEEQLLWEIRMLRVHAADLCRAGDDYAACVVLEESDERELVLRRHLAKFGLAIPFPLPDAA